jgi:hypothetical protein
MNEDNDTPLSILDAVRRQVDTEAFYSTSLGMILRIQKSSDQSFSGNDGPLILESFSPDGVLLSQHRKRHESASAFILGLPRALRTTTLLALRNPKDVFVPNSRPYRHFAPLVLR